MKNLNLLFTKLYYANMVCDGDDVRLDENAVKKNNDILFGAEFDPSRDYEKPFSGVETFRLQTGYPGMIVGAGNPHDGGLSNSEIKNGFSFDYVTGQPYIPGSSVKGVLRSCFEKYPEVIMELTGCTEDDIKPLVEEIFDGTDVFLDAVVCRGGAENKLIGEDYITPHSSPIKAPIPIYIIKLVPGVAFEFRFILKEREDSLISASAKLQLFEKLLVLFGIGAKTNVGYGGLQKYDGKAVYQPPVSPTASSNNRQQPARNGYQSPNRNQHQNGYRNPPRRY